MFYKYELWSTHATLWILPVFAFDLESQYEGFRYVWHLGWLRYGITIKVK